MYNSFNRRALQFIIEGDNDMDYLIDGIIIVFVLSCIVFFYNALKIQHGSKNFPTPKEDPPKVDQKAISDVNYERAKMNNKLLFWILMFIGIALASFSLIIDHVGVSINQ